MSIRSIEWKNNAIRIIDQTKLPLKLEYVEIRGLPALYRAIRELKVRGAPALGAASALGVYLGIKDSRAVNFKSFKKEADRIVRFLGSARPTARNLFWGLEKMRRVIVNNRKKSVKEIKKLLFREAQRVIEEDRSVCRKIGEFGAKLFRNNDRVLTICNAGILATIDYGTALGVLYKAKEEGKRIKVFACETRPLLQGARLSVWELQKKGIDVTLICDNMAATLMRQGKIDKVITGADRIAANGDTANKIGTYNLAVLSRYHKIPLYVAAPHSTFDLKIKNGQAIHIEQRPAEEVIEQFFKKPIAPRGTRVFNPAFDITAHHLISAMITDKGIIRRPYLKNIKKIILE